MRLFTRNEAEKRKKRSIGILKKRGVPYIEWLPVIAEKAEVTLKRPEEIAKRVIACLITIQVACELEQGCEDMEACATFFREQLEAYGVADCLTEQEKRVFAGVATPQERVEIIWQYERCRVLLWALGMGKALDFPSGTCDCAATVALVTRHDSLSSFCKAVRMRSVDNILNEADLIYRYDWACTNARIQRSSMPGGMNAGVVLERHMALNWLIGAEGAENWDHITADT